MSANTGPITVFQARRILTMNRRQPLATHVAVRDGRVLAVGDAQRVAAWGSCHAGHALCRARADARPGRGPLAPDGRRAVAVSLRRLPCPHGARRPGVDRLRRFRRRDPAPERDRARDDRSEPTAGGLGFRPDLLRQRAHDGAPPGPCLRDAAGRDPARQPAPDERQLGGPIEGRHHPRHRGRGHRALRRWRAQRRAAGVRRDVPDCPHHRQHLPHHRRQRDGAADVRAHRADRRRDDGHRSRSTTCRTTTSRCCSASPPSPTTRCASCRPTSAWTARSTSKPAWPACASA